MIDMMLDYFQLRRQLLEVDRWLCLLTRSLNDRRGKAGIVLNQVGRRCRRKSERIARVFVDQASRNASM